MFNIYLYMKHPELEYAIDRKDLVPVIKKIDKLVKDKNFLSNFAFEIRWVQADDIYLSPAYKRDSCFLTMCMYGQEDQTQRFFHCLEKIFREFQGRPHWGKIHYLTEQELKPLYPQWREFIRVRETVDPTHTFSNGYLDRVLGTTTK